MDDLRKEKKFKDDTRGYREENSRKTESRDTAGSLRLMARYF